MTVLNDPLVQALLLGIVIGWVLTRIGGGNGGARYRALDGTPVVPPRSRSASTGGNPKGVQPRGTVRPHPPAPVPPNATGARRPGPARSYGTADAIESPDQPHYRRRADEDGA